MPPKKTAAQAAKAANNKKKSEAEEQQQVPDHAKNESEQEDGDDDDNDEEMKDPSSTNSASDDNTAPGQKRKSPPTSTKNLAPPKKEPRQGTRSSSRTPSPSQTSPSSKQILNFLLSKDSLEYCFPADELDAAKSGKFSKCYSRTPPSLFTPFEHLVTAHLLSKPLSHTLGMRSVRTLLNAPYSFSTPSQMHRAGETNIWHALEDARTQHRQKTASYLFSMAEQYAAADPKSTSDNDTNNDDDTDEMLALATEANATGPQGTIAHIKSSIKGIGDTGAQIFCRRIQAVDGWGEAIWPYADPRSLDAVRECGITGVADATDLQETIERDVDWAKVGDMGFLDAEQKEQGLGEVDYEVQVAVEFVTLLERALGCCLERNVAALKKAAAEWTGAAVAAAGAK